MNRWTRRLDDENLPSKHIREALTPIIDQWLGRKAGNLTYRSTQLLTGHGCFGEFLNRIGKATTAKCMFCEEQVDTSQHTREECPEWDGPRATLREKFGPDISLRKIVEGMASDEGKWTAFTAFAETVMIRKDEEEKRRKKETKRQGSNRNNEEASQAREEDKTTTQER